MASPNLKLRLCPDGWRWLQLKYFGDSFDIVKKSLIQWLTPFGPWAVHPMFTHSVTADEAAMFSHFVGAPLVSTEVLSIGTDRRAYLAECGDCRSLFLDPDTGVRLRPRPQQRRPEFVFADELVEIVNVKADGLVLVYDQSLARGRERQQLIEKLEYFRNVGIAGFAYVSHASFLVLGRSGVIQQARAILLEASRLPQSRILDM